MDGAVEIRSGGKTLSKLGPGEFFGEMCLLDNQPRSADVVAVQPSRVLVVTAWNFTGAERIFIKPQDSDEDSARVGPSTA